MCGHIVSLNTKTKFVILMHPKEFRKIKNGTGHLTHLSLENSELYVEIDFSNHKRVNELINDPEYCSYLLYPSKKSTTLNDHRIDQAGKTNVVFILDATWGCSKKMLRLSTNLQDLPHISFEHNKISQFEIKEQPADYCLSTIESTLCVLELLNENRDEVIEGEKLENLLNPFKKMIRYQQIYTDKKGIGDKNSVRYKKRK